MVDNRYSGVGHEPPFETPTDNDLLAAHNEALKDELTRLHTALRGLVKAARNAEPCFNDWIKLTGFGETNRRDKAVLAAIQAAIAAAEAEVK